MRGEGSGRFRRTMRPRARDSQPPATAFVRIGALRSFSRVGPQRTGLGTVLHRKAAVPVSSEPAYQLAVILLNYRTPGLVVDCLRSLDGQIDATRERVVVVDNASGDGSAASIRDAILAAGWSSWATLLEVTANHGFSAGNNAGICSIRAQAYLLLNSDTIVRPSAIEELRRALASHPEADLFSPRLEWPDGTPQCSVFRLPSAWSEFDRSARTGLVSRMLRRHLVSPPIVDRPVPFAWASFAAILVRRRVFERIGLMDEGYFLYFEDVDFCNRARRAGFRGLHWPAARIVHLQGGSGPVVGSIALRRRPPPYYYAARSRYFGKFHGRPGLAAANLMWVLGRAISGARELLRNKAPHLCEKEGRDLWRGFTDPVNPRESWRGALD